MTKRLGALEAEDIFVLREVAPEFDRPVLLFSGGKDSIVTSHLARKAFWPGSIPFPLTHMDTERNFHETLVCRDRWITKIGARLIVRSVEESIEQRRVTRRKGLDASRDALQSVTLRDAIREFRFDCTIDVLAAMKRSHGPKNDSSPCVMNSANGTQEINAPSCGHSATGGETPVSISA